MEALAEATAEPSRAYFTGGATAVLEGWRQATVDVDVHLVPERDSVLRAIPALKEVLRMNIELASPAHFIPELPGWRDRCRFIDRVGSLEFFHYDFYAQALSKIARGLETDLQDVQAMVARGLVEPATAWELFGRIEPQLYRYTRIDPDSFRKAVEAALGAEPKRGRGAPEH